MISDKELRQLMAINKRGEAYCPKGDELLLSALEELLQRRQAEAERKSRQETHWEGCWREHHGCAVAMLEKLLAHENLLCWDTEYPEHGAADPDDFAAMQADGMGDDQETTMDVQVASRLPDRKMRVWLTGGEDRIVNWEWVI